MSDNNPPSEVSSFRLFLDKTHSFIDTHPRTIRNIAYGCGAAGVVLILRSIHVGKIFRHGRDIPKRFITKGVNLQGNVREINLDGVIFTQHVPVIDLRLPWKRTQRTDAIPLTLAFVELNSSSKKWMESNLLDKNVWFQVLKVEKDNELVQSAIYQQKFIVFKKCVNETLVKEGMCRVMDLSDEEVKNLSPVQTALLHRMIALEKTADKKGRGIWKEQRPPIKDTVKRISRKLFWAPVDFVKYCYGKVRPKSKT